MPAASDAGSGRGGGGLACSCCGSCCTVSTGSICSRPLTHRPPAPTTLLSLPSRTSTTAKLAASRKVVVIYFYLAAEAGQVALLEARQALEVPLAEGRVRHRIACCTSCTSATRKRACSTA